MEKKGSGRGLEEISKIFLSSEKKQEKAPISGLSAITIRTNTTCHSCVNMIEGSSKELKCRIFTFEYEKYGVPHMSTIHSTYANYCENYKPEGAEKSSGPVQHTSVAPGPIDPSKTGKVDIKELATIISELDQDYSEIEETLTIYKKISYPDTTKAREDLQKALSDFTENGYSIEAVELVRHNKTSKPQETKVTEEKVSLFVKK